MKTHGYILFLISLCFSCSTISKDNLRDLNEHLSAENRLLKKRISLLQRENNVISLENIEYKKRLKLSIAKIEKLKLSVKTLNEKYKNDIALANNNYNNLQEKNRILEKESSEKIKELTELSRQIEKDLSEKIKSLNRELQEKEDRFGKDRENLKNEFTQKEYNLLKNIDDMKKNINIMEKEMSELKGVNKEMQVQLDELKKEISLRDDALSRSNARIKELEAAQQKK